MAGRAFAAAGAAVLLLAAVILAACSSNPEAGTPIRRDDLSAFVPAPGEAPDWAASGEAQRFEGDDLYVYINGGAEIFNEYGFRRVLAQDFSGPSGHGVTLEIFEMTGPEAAFGMYTFKTSGTGSPAGFGADSELEEYYLSFWKGPYVVTVTGFDGTTVSLEGVQAVAGAVDARMPDSAGRPAFVSALPDEWTGPGLKYLRGPLGLYNLRPFFTRDVFRFREALSIRTGSARVFVFGYGDSGEAADRLAEAGAAMAASPGYRDIQIRPDGTVEGEASDGNRILARTRGKIIALALAPGDPVGLDALLDQIRVF